MSGKGAPKLKVTGSGLRVFIVASSWHDEIMGALVSGAEKELRASGVADINLLRVPGAFELPMGAAVAIEAGADAVIALGVVIRGETPHFDYVCDAATSGLMQVQLQHKVPIGFGLLTVNSEAEALARSGAKGSKEDKGSEAVQAALAMVALAN